MFNVCPKCGMYHADKIIKPEGPAAVCPDCGYQHPFKQLPLFIITGASGVGKTTVCVELSKICSEVISIESDILWRNEFNKPDNDYRSYRELWLRMCKNISQGGKPIALFGSVVPDQFENCIERRYFTKLHYLALVCENNILSERLMQRPGWRNCGSEDFIKAHVDFNSWFKNNSQNTTPAITLLDNSYDSTEMSAKKIQGWICERL